MRRLLLRLFLSCGTTPKDGATNIAAVAIAVSGLGGYCVQAELFPDRYLPVFGAIAFSGAGITSWATGKTDDLGLM